LVKPVQKKPATTTSPQPSASTKNSLILPQTTSSLALSTLKGKTPGYDLISNCIIKNLPTNFKHRIINIYNEIISSHIPQSFKLSLVLPILKPQKPQTDVKSYGPTSLNSCLTKILDKIIAKRLWWFVLNNELIHNSQFGFRRGKSVLDSLLYVDHQIHCPQDKPNNYFCRVTQPQQLINLFRSLLLIASRKVALSI